MRSTHSYVQMEFLFSFRIFPFLITSKNETHLSIALEMNWLKATTFPFKLWTSLIIFGASISLDAFIFSELASISREFTMKSKNFLDTTPKVHFKMFSFIPYFRRTSNFSAKSSTWFPKRWLHKLIVHINFHRASSLIFEHHVYQFLIGWSRTVIKLVCS